MPATPEQRILEAITELDDQGITPSVRKVRQLSGAGQAQTMQVLRDWRAGNIGHITRPVAAPALEEDDFKAFTKPLNELVNRLYAKWDEEVKGKLSDAGAVASQAVEEASDASRELEEARNELAKFRAERDKFLAETTRAQAAEEQSAKRAEKAEAAMEAMRVELDALRAQLSEASIAQAKAEATLEAYRETATKRKSSKKAQPSAAVSTESTLFDQ